MFLYIFPGGFGLFKIIDHGERIIGRNFCVMRAVTDASAAVNAEFVYDMSFPAMYPDRLGRTVLDAVDASLTGGFAQAHGAHEFVMLHRQFLLYRFTFIVMVVP